MSQTVNVNGVSINYPETGDTGWGDEATDFAVQTSSALSKLGLSTGIVVDIPGNLDVTGVTTLDSNLSVGGNSTVTGNSSVTGNSTVTGNLTVNGNTTLGNATSDTITITGAVAIDTNVLIVDPTNNRIGINKTSPAQALDVVGNSAISGNETVGGTLGVTGNTTLSGTLGVTGNTTLTGQLLNSDGTASLPGISFSSDTNTGIFRSASDQIDIVTGGNSRFRIESTGQIKAVYESQVGTDYNTTLHNGYLCRAWCNFDGTGTVAIRASGNVSSITDNGTGDYSINFTTAMPDANYAVLGFNDFSSGNNNVVGIYVLNSSSSFRVRSGTGHVYGTTPGTLLDCGIISIGVFR